jgi:hypothetical protein
MTPAQRKVLRKLRKLGWKVKVEPGRKHDKLHVLVEGKILKFPLASSPSAGWEAQLKAVKQQVKRATVDILIKPLTFC